MKYKGYILLTLAALCYASMSLLIRTLSVDFGPYWQTFLRLVVSMILTAGLVLLRRKSLKLAQRSDYALMLPMGVVGYGAQILLFTLSLYHDTIGNTLFVFSAYPLFAALLAHFFLGERLTRRLGVAMVLLVCVLFLLFDPNNLTRYLTGNMYALLACLCFALYILCSRLLSRHGNAPETTTLWSVTLAALTSGAAAIGVDHTHVALHPRGALYLILFGVLNAAAFNLVNAGFRTVDAGVGTMILLLEPLIGSILGLIVFHEIPTLTFCLGAVIMVTAVYIATFVLDGRAAEGEPAA